MNSTWLRKDGLGKLVLQYLTESYVRERKHFMIIHFINNLKELGQEREKARYNQSPSKVQWKHIIKGSYISFISEVSFFSSPIYISPFKKNCICLNVDLDTPLCFTNKTKQNKLSYMRGKVFMKSCWKLRIN